MKNIDRFIFALLVTWLVCLALSWMDSVQKARQLDVQKARQLDEAQNSAFEAWGEVMRLRATLSAHGIDVDAMEEF